MSVQFAMWASLVWVVRRGPGERVREWQVRIIDEPDHGLIEVGTDVMPGDEIYETDFFGRRKHARVVADVDWDRQSHLKRGVITWAGFSRVHQSRKEAHMEINLQRYGTLLLDWLYDKVDDKPRIENLGAFYVDHSLPEGWGRLVVDNLTDRGLVQSLKGIGGRLNVKLTASGIDFVQKIRAERNDPVRRSRELQQRMLRWLYSQEYSDSPPLDWTAFLASEGEQFWSAPFTLTELEREAGYLVDSNFIIGAKIDQAGSGMIKPRLTASGRDCVMDFGGGVSNYLNRHSSSGTTNNVTMTSSTGNIVVASENVVQNLKAGIDTRKLLEFAGFVHQVLPTLGLANHEQAGIASDATELYAAAEVVDPDRGRLKKLIEAVLGGLAKAVPSVVTSTAIAMGNDAVRALTASH
jgi:hypothetical protein